MVLCIALFGAARVLAPYVPFSWEQELAGSLDESLGLDFNLTDVLRSSLRLPIQP